MSVSQFAFHDRVPSTPPDCDMATLHTKLEKLIKNMSIEKALGKMSAAEKQQIFDNTRGYKGSYRQGGWQWDFRPFMKRFIVNTYGDWEAVYAFNKTNIRKNGYTQTGVQEIHEIPKI